MLKTCSKCHNDLPLDQFSKGDRSDGLQDSCKLCVNNYNKEYYKKNKEKIKTSSRLYHHSNKDIVSKKHKSWRKKNEKTLKDKSKSYRDKNINAIRKKQRELYHKNREERLLQVKIYYDNNKSVCNRRSETYRKTNRDKVNKRRNQRSLEDPIYKLEKTLRGRLHSDLKSANVQKQIKTLDLIGCSIKDLKSHIESLFLPGMSWDNHGVGKDNWHIDHIRPCASFDLFNIEQQYNCFHYTNLRPIWGFENFSKGSLYNGFRHKYKK